MYPSLQDGEDTEEQLEDCPDDSDSGEVLESGEEGSCGTNPEPETVTNPVSRGCSKQDHSSGSDGGDGAPVSRESDQSVREEESSGCCAATACIHVR